MGSLYRSQHELVFVFKQGNARHINNVELGRFGRNRTNVWAYAGANTFGKERDRELAMHPTVKPLGLVADAILDCSNRGGIILDAFAGSGTTLIAAEKTGRHGRGIEVDPHYVDTIIQRFRDTYDLEATHVASDIKFDALKAQRSKGRQKKMTKTPKSRGRTGSGGAGKGRASGSPPDSTRFKKGFSGNPTGRPKGSKNLATLFKAAAKHPVEAKINGKLRKITTAQATIMQLAANAVRGDPRATAKFLDYLDEFEKRAAAAKPTQYPLSDADIEVLHAVYERMQQCDGKAD